MGEEGRTRVGRGREERIGEGSVVESKKSLNRACLSEMLCVIKRDAVYVRQLPFVVLYFVFVICLCVLAILLTIVVLHLHLRADSKPTTAMPAWVSVHCQARLTGPERSKVTTRDWCLAPGNVHSAGSATYQIF